MQREIKFRAWNKYTGMMEVMSIGDGRTLGYPLTEKSHVRCFYDEDHGAYSTWSGYSDERRTMDGSKSDCILMQFTGLKDKNGKEIYEGDILRDPKGIGVVYFYPPSFVVQTREEEPYALAKGKVNVKQLEETEIIGNIYENPALLSNPQ